MQEIATNMDKSEREIFGITHISNPECSDPVVGDKLQEKSRKWLSPPDPWNNHNTAQESHHKGTSTWFVQGNTFAAWKSSGPDLLLWINGKRGCLNLTSPYSR